MGTTYATLGDLPKHGTTAASLVPIASEHQTAALAAASSVVDSYLRSRFTLPLTTWGDDVRQTVCQLAAYNLLVTRGLDPEGGKTIGDRYKAAIKWLEAVQEGRATPEGLDAVGGQSIVPADTPFVLSPQVVSAGGGSDADLFEKSGTDGSGQTIAWGPPTIRGW